MMMWLMCLGCLIIFLLHPQVFCSSAFSSNSSSTPLCPHDQSIALLHFKNTFSFTSNASASWDQYGSGSHPKMLNREKGTDCCSWDGVTCDRVTGHVIGIDVSCSWLQGTIHSNNSLFLLTDLQCLNLAFNDLNPSRISSLFGQFANLTHLNLSNSGFSGNIPSKLSLQSKLVSLDFSGNLGCKLETLIFKRFVQNVTELRELFLDCVDMRLVELASFRNLSSSLKDISLGYCGLRGKFPDDIFHLPNLRMLDLSQNGDLIGYLPTANWSSPLKILKLTFTSFLGKIPHSIGNLNSLNYLDLQGCEFLGSILASLWNFTQIRHLDLSDNHFTSEIPSSLSNPWQLTFLNLRDNNFSGHLPSLITNLTQLVTLDLSYNQLTGPIPSQVLPNLNGLHLSHNSLNGTIPHWLFALPSLVYLELSYNQLTGHIHEFQYNSVEYIILGNNQLHGPISRSISQLVNLTCLTLSSNNLSGIVKLDEFLMLNNLMDLDLSLNSLSCSTNSNVKSSLPNLTVLRLSSCDLSEFPYFLGTQETLQELDLSNNKIHGQIPNWVRDMGKDSLLYLNLSSNFLTSVDQLPWKNLGYLDLHSNLLQGPLLPLSICHLSSLEVLILSNNSFSGLIPECLVNFSISLSVLDLRMNRFHGTIPGTFAKGNSLRNLDFNGNQLERPIPRSLINCRKLQVLDLGNNKITSTFPYWLETLSRLQVLVLRSNKFHGSIWDSKAEHPFPKLRIFDLSKNDFSGPLPTKFIRNLKAMMNLVEDQIEPKYMGDEYYYDSVKVTIKGFDIELVKILTIFTTLDLSNNRFEGEIPKSIGKLTSLRILNFSRNSLTGQIPSSMKNMRNLESLDLSSNNLSGEILGQLTSLTFLAFLNLSHNHLVGLIPRGKQFDTFQNDSYSGNSELCGIPLSKKCSDDEAPPPPPLIFQEEDDQGSAIGFEWKAVMMGYGCGMVFGWVMGYLIFLTGKLDWLIRIVEGIRGKKVKGSNRSARGGRRIGGQRMQVAFLGK